MPIDSAIEITGAERDRLIEKLVVEKALIKMSVGKGAASTITVVTGVRAEGREALFSVDCPDQIRSAILEHGPAGIHFEWTWRDNIPYRFKVNDVHEIGGNLWFPFPDTILYFQKRRHFRVSAPEGTILSFKRGDDTFRIGLSDISMGGLRCDRWDAKTMRGDLILKKGDLLENAKVSFRSGESISVPLAEVRWVAHDRNRRRYGIQFKQMNGCSERKLIALIYRLQRDYLRRRLPMDDSAWNRIR